MNELSRKFPQLRFIGFYEEWIERKIANLGIYVSDGNYGPLYPKSDEFESSGIPFIRVNNIKNGKIIWDDMRYISSELHSILLSGHLEEGDVLVSTRGEIGLIAYTSKDFIDANINAQLCLLRSKVIYPKYLFCVLSSSNIQKQMKELQTGSALKQLTRKNLDEISICFPGKLEQEKIGDFFELLDQSIENLEEKIGLLELQKKGIMHKIFSQRLRSQDFGNSWKSKTFEELFEFRSTNSLSRDKLTTVKGTIMNIHYGDIHTKFGMLLDVNKQDLPFISNGVNAIFEEADLCKDMDIMFADASEDYDGVGKSIELMNVGSKRIVSGLHTILARQKTNEMHPGFLGYLMNSSFIHDQIKFYAVGTKVYSISKSNLLKIIVTYPSKSEQKSIVDLLHGIDQRIDNTRDLFEQMKLLKKWLMSKMFL